MTEFLRWDPGKLVKVRIPPPRPAEWLLIMGIYGVLFGLIGGCALYACLSFFIAPSAIAYWEAALVCAVPMSIVGALHLAGGDKSAGTLEIDWEQRCMSCASLSGTQRFDLSDLQALVLRGEYYRMGGSTDRLSRRWVYHARLDAQFPQTTELLLATDSREQHVEVAVEQLAPFAVELADALQLELRSAEPIEERHKGFLRALLSAPAWLNGLFILLCIASAGWVTWRVQPAWSSRQARNQLRRSVEERGGYEATRDSWTIGGTDYGSVTEFSFADRPLTDDDLLALREPLLACESFMLDLSGTRLTDRGLQAVAGNENLVSINLYGTQVGDRGIETLCGCPALIELGLNRTPVSDEALPCLAQLSHLKCLRLWGTRVTDDGLEDLMQLNGLREIYLNDTAVTSEGVETLRAALPDAQIHE